MSNQEIREKAVAYKEAGNFPAEDFIRYLKEHDIPIKK